MNTLAAVRDNAVGRPNARDDERPRGLIGQTVHTALTPVRVATSPTAIKAYLGALLFLTASVVLLSISTGAYLFFYFKYIPQIDLERIVYLQYGPGIHPHATTALETSALISQQAYDVDVILHMPRTPQNLAAGNFMLDLSLITADTTPGETFNASSLVHTETPLYRSRRPAILPYTSLLTSLSYTLFYLPVHLLSLRDIDAATLTIPLFEKVSFPRGRQSIPTHTYLEVQSQTALDNGGTQQTSIMPNLHIFSSGTQGPSSGQLQIYSTHIRFRAHFQGLRYIIYNHRIFSFLVFTTLFYTVTITSLVATWALISSLLSSSDQPLFTLQTENQAQTTSSTSKANQKQQVVKSEDSSSQKPIKSEPSTTTKSESQTQLYSIKPEPGVGEEIDSSDEDAMLQQARDEAAGILSDTGSTTFPTIGRHAPPLRYTPSSSTVDIGPGNENEDEDENEEGVPRNSVRRDDMTHDAEDEDDEEEDEAEIERRERERLMVERNSRGRKSGDDSDEDEGRGRDVGDSGIGTSMDSEVGGAAGSGLTRRRSARGSGGESRNRGR